MTCVSKELRELSVTSTMLDQSNSNKDQHIILSAAEQTSAEARVLAAKQN